ncbi:MAG: hypothetical protein IPO26_21185 [Saprospiraceae bacterium]|nr:hypothetical protein [Saprospiraceae bacterium]
MILYIFNGRLVLVRTVMATQKRIPPTAPPADYRPHASRSMYMVGKAESIPYLKFKPS